MFLDMLYFLGLLPKILQIGILIIFGLVSYRIFSNSNTYLTQPVFIFLCYYTLTKLIYFIFGISNSTVAIFIILMIYFAYVLFVRLGLLGILLSIIVFIWINSFNTYTTILTYPIFTVVITLSAIHIISQFIDISIFKEIVYLIIAIPLLLFIKPSLILEAVFLFELLIRCIFQSKIYIDGVAKFFCFIITCFTGVYLIELIFAHFWLSVIIILIIRFILKIIS